MRLSLLCLMLAGAACREPAAPPVDVTYHLSAIKGEVLPWTLSEGTTSRTEIFEGSVTLNVDLTFSRTTVQRITNQSGRALNPFTHSGTYTKGTDGSVMLVYRVNGQNVTISGQVLATALTLNVTNDPWTYER